MARSRAKLDGAVLHKEANRSSLRLKALEAAKENPKRHHPETDAAMTTGSVTINSAVPAIDYMDPAVSSTAMDGIDLRNKRKSESDLKVPATKTAKKLKKVAVHLAPSPNKEKRKSDPFNGINWRRHQWLQALSRLENKISLIASCAMIHFQQSSVTKKNPMVYKQFCATCWALKKPGMQGSFRCQGKHN